MQRRQIIIERTNIWSIQDQKANKKFIKGTGSTYLKMWIVTEWLWTVLDEKAYSKNLTFSCHWGYTGRRGMLLVMLESWVCVNNMMPWHHSCSPHPTHTHHLPHPDCCSVLCASSEPLAVCVGWTEFAPHTERSVAVNFISNLCVFCVCVCCILWLWEHSNWRSFWTSKCELLV